MINIFNRKKVTFLDNTWKTLKTDVKISSIPRAHELIYFNSVYYRVCNVVYNVTNDKCEDIFVIIEEYSDDFKLKKENT